MKGAKILLALTICTLTAAVAAAESSSDNNTTSFWNNQGGLLIFQYKFEDALNAYNNSLKIDGSNVAALIGRGSALNGLGMHNESLESYQKAIEISPDNAEPIILKGVALQDLGRYNDSLQSYNHALELDPTNGNALNDKAWLSYKQGNNEEAITSADRAIDILSIDLAAALDTKGVALAALGKNNDAIGYINKSLDLDPLNSVVWIHKGDILKAMGRNSEAEAAYAKVKELPSRDLDEESV